MINTKDMMDCIDSRKEDIANAISLSLAEGNQKKAESLYPFCLERITKSKIFIFESNDKILTSYEKDVIKYLEDISDYLGYNVKGTTIYL